MVRSTLFSVLALLAVSFIHASASDVILKPLDGKEGPEAAFIIIQGAQIGPEKYIPLAQAIQQASPLKLWIALPQYPLDAALPIGFLFEQPIHRVLSTLHDQGFSDSSPYFFGGHSLGGASIQDYVHNHPDRIMGQILMGSCLLRKYRNGTYPVPTLTLNGELDGMMRTSRVAEAYYHSILYPKQPTSNFQTFPVVLIMGTNHMQYASGDPPSAVRKKDLKPEVEDNMAHQLMATIISNFITVRMSSSSSSSSSTPMSPLITAAAIHDLEIAVQQTGEFVKPLINSLEMEAFIHFKPPCNSDTPSPHCPYYPAWPLQDKPRVPSTNTQCTCGNPWVQQVAMNTMAGLPEGYEIYNVDAIHDVTDTKPYHHAHLWNDCVSPAKLPCTLNTTTVSQNIYDTFDDFDTGFTHVSASEIRVKMRSRQTLYVASINPNAQLSDTDKESICAQINKISYEWALSNANPKTVDRFRLIGTPMTFADDIIPIVPAGPLWIYNSLKYQSIKDGNGNNVLEIKAPTMKTSLDGPETKLYPDSAGYHYCKLLSPARAMEWVYGDGLARPGQ